MDVKGKELFDTMCDLSNKMAGLANLHEHMELDESFEVSSMLKIDILCFLAYLAASDNVISWNEARYIGDLLDIHMTPDRLNEIIIEKNIYSTEFEERPPMMLQLFVEMDNAIYESNADIDDELGAYLMKLYMVVGIGLVESNGESVDNEEFLEKSDFEIYLNMMRNFIDNNTKRHHTDIIFNHSKDGNENIGYRKNNGSVKAPKKKM